MSTTASAQYSLTLRVEIDHLPGMLGKVASAIGDAGVSTYELREDYMRILPGR